MFKSWEEYAMHLINNIIQEDDRKKQLMKIIEKERVLFSDEIIQHDYWRTIINTVLSSDWDFTKHQNFITNHDVLTYKKFKKGIRYYDMLKSPKFLTPNEKMEVINYVKNGNRDTESI